MNESNRLLKSGAQRGGRGDFTIPEDNPTTIAFINTRQNLDQGRFPGSVLAKQGQNFSGLDLDADPIDHRRVAKAFDDAFHPEQVRITHGRYLTRKHSGSRGELFFTTP